MRLVALTFAAVLAAWSFAAVAAASPAGGVDVTLTTEGWPLLTTPNNRYEDAGKVAWRVCAPLCGPVVSREPEYEPGPTAAGVTFELTRTVDRRTTVTRSPIWQGQAAQLTPPTLTGAATPGSTVTATAGAWSGGWPTDRSDVVLRACPGPNATAKRNEEECKALSGATEERPTSVSRVLGAAYTGWYVGAVEAREEAGFVDWQPDDLLRDVTFRSYLPAPSSSRFVAVSPLVGPIPPPTAEQEPTVKWAARATRRNGKLTLGVATCPIACGFRVSVVGIRGRGVTAADVSGVGTFTLRVPTKGLKKQVRRLHVIASAEGFAYSGLKLLRVR